MVTGTVQPKGKYYHCVLDLNSTSKKRAQKWISTGLTIRGNKRKAEEILKQQIEKYEALENTSNMDFADYCRKWLEEKMISLEITTYTTYEAQVKHIIDYFQPLHIPLCKLKASDINDFYHYLATSGNKSAHNTGEGLSARTIKDISQRLRSILLNAELLEEIEKTPARGIKPPTPLNPNKAVDDDDLYLDEEELKIFYTQIKDEPLMYLFIMTVYCGFRREEVAGLNWNRINFENRTIDIVETRVRAGGKEYTKSRTKNTASHRTYPMTDYLFALLTTVKQEQEQNKKMFGNSYIPNNNEVFTWEDGRPFRLDYITKRFKAIIRRAPELDDRLHFHDLRKTCISNLFLKGFSIKEVQKWVGQSDVETTIRIYNKLKQKDKNRVAKGLDNTFKNIAPFTIC